MNYRDRIINAVRNFTPFVQGNYVATLSTKLSTKGEVKTIRVSMFGNEIFWRDSENNDGFDFCGHEGNVKTTRALNYCLEGLGADFRLTTHKNKQTKLTEVIKVQYIYGKTIKRKIYETR